MPALPQSKHYMYYAIVIFVAVSTTVGFSLYMRQAQKTVATSSANSTSGGNLQDMHQAVPVPTAPVLDSTSSVTVKQLLYLIEEEKLAHDVYLKMFEKYGARTFGNILKSEDHHQSHVLSLLDARNVTDPRSETIGVFTDPSLQKLYNDLIAQGQQSLTESYKAGIAIEELDIADIKADLAVLDPSQTDIKTTLELLLRGSENHLRAFSRQVR